MKNFFLTIAIIISSNGFRNKLEALQNVTPNKIDEGIIACLELNEALK